MESSVAQEVAALREEVAGSTEEGMELKVRSVVDSEMQVGGAPDADSKPQSERPEVQHDDLKRKRAEDEAPGESKELQDTTETTEKQQVRNVRYKKRKVALFVSYSGHGYQGMQRNKGARTIEGDLEEALFKAGAIAESTFGDPRKIDWARAARTDKGVSAVGQVVSGRFFIDPPGLVERVNSHLPEQIRVLGYTRVTGAFNAKNLCDRRRYEYVVPLFAFDPASHLNDAATGNDSGETLVKDEEEDGEVEEKKLIQGPVCSCESLDSSYVFDDGEKERLNGILKNFVGTHNFHNFTCRIKPEDPSTQRYIISYEAGDVFSIQGREFVRCIVVGQSFMLHQIRKMIGLAVAIMRGFAPESIFETAFRKDVKINVPMAPELGLFLDECLYTAYNQRYAETHEEVSLKDFEKVTGEFKAGVIYPHIASTEAKEKVFARWLHGLTPERYPNLRG